MLVAVGLSHATTPVEVRGRVAPDAAAVDEWSARATAGPFAEAMIVSTCNRLEVYGVTETPDAARDLVVALMAARADLPVAALAPLVYTRTDAEAVGHVFRVASGLDSMVVGEPQIAGQVKEAFAEAERRDSVGPGLHALLAHAFTVVKRVRTETALGQHAVSVASVAAELAAKIFGDLRTATVLLVGAGQTAELAARHLLGHGVVELRVANRTAVRAEELAAALGGEAVAFDGIADALAAVDVVVTATGASAPIISRRDVERAAARRGRRPLFLVDLAVPCDIEPAAGEVAGVFRYDVDDLARVAAANLAERGREARRAEALVASEADRFLARMRERHVGPTVAALRERVEAIRRAEVARTLARLPDASPETCRVVEALSTAIVNKLLHEPMVALREHSRRGDPQPWIAFVSQLFALPQRGAEAPGAATGSSASIAGWR